MSERVSEHCFYCLSDRTQGVVVGIEDVAIRGVSLLGWSIFQGVLGPWRTLCRQRETANAVHLKKTIIQLYRALY